MGCVCVGGGGSSILFNVELLYIVAANKCPCSVFSTLHFKSISVGGC